MLNRAVGKARIFGKQRDCEAFDSGDRREAKERLPMRILAWCVPSNHWFVLWPRGDGDLSEFTRWLTVTHTQRIARTASHVRNRPPCTGAVSSRSRGDEDDHLLTVLAVRGTQTLAGQHGPRGRGMALVESLASSPRRRRRAWWTRVGYDPFIVAALIRDTVWALDRLIWRPLRQQWAMPLYGRPL